MYILYGGRFTRTRIVEMVMAEGDIAYELREVDIFKQEHRSPSVSPLIPFNAQRKSHGRRHHGGDSS